MFCAVWPCLCLRSCLFNALIVVVVVSGCLGEIGRCKTLVVASVELKRGKMAVEAVVALGLPLFVAFGRGYGCGCGC